MQNHLNRQEFLAKIQKMVVQKTPYKTVRIFVYFETYQNLLDFWVYRPIFDFYAIWGNTDKDNTYYLSWEFNVDFYEVLFELFKTSKKVEFYE